MKRNARIQGVLEYIRSRGTVTIDELAKEAGVSTSTARRDVDHLQERGEVLALRGGLVQVDSRLTGLPAGVGQDASRNGTQKNAIASLAAQKVQDGETIYLDSGSTVLQMLPYLEGTSVRVVTSNTGLLSVSPPRGVELTVLPGDYVPELASICGAWTDATLRGLFFDRAFLGASGLSERGGITAFDLREAAKKGIVHQQSEATYVLLDSSKFGQTAFCKAVPVEECIVISEEFDPLLELAGGFEVAKCQKVRA